MSLICSGTMVAPTTIASHYLPQAWTGAVILSFVWFLHRWKTNVFSRALLGSSVAGLDREKLLALDKISSVGLIVIGIMALAEACGVAVQSILTVGGIGGRYHLLVISAVSSLMFFTSEEPCCKYNCCLSKSCQFPLCFTLFILPDLKILIYRLTVEVNLMNSSPQ